MNNVGEQDEVGFCHLQTVTCIIIQMSVTGKDVPQCNAHCTTNVIVNVKLALFFSDGGTRE